LRERSNRKKAKKCLFAAIVSVVALVIVIIYGLFVEPNRFTISRHILGEKIDSRNVPLKLIQISDLHIKQFNSRARRIAAQIERLEPDIIVFTGDSIDRADRLQELEEFLSLLNDRIPKYAILGNWEHWAGVDLDRLNKIYADRNCRMLVNESIAYERDSQHLLITGLDDSVGQPNLSLSLQNIDPSPNHLLLAHSPVYRDAFSQAELKLLNEYKPQYIFSGHTHGGQISFFGLVPLRPPNSGRYVSGWYRDGSIPLYVSRGLGVSVLPVRIGAVPEIAYFEWFL
jgi:predicted MPP superfamily phosphohydrolase